VIFVQQKVVTCNQDQSSHHVAWMKHDMFMLKTFNSFHIVYSISCFHIFYALSP